MLKADHDEAAFEDMWEFLNSHQPQEEMGLDEDGLCGLLIYSLLLDHRLETASHLHLLLDMHTMNCILSIWAR